MPILGIIASSKLTAVPGTYESISTVTVGATSVANIEFTSIPATYVHLQIRCFVQADRATYGISDGTLQFNSDTATNYSWHNLKGTGSTVTATASASQTWMNVADGMWGTNTGGTFGAGIIDVLDYANTSKYKTIRTLSGVDINGTIAGYGGWLGLTSGNWRNTNAVTSIKIIAGSGNFLQYSSFVLYGIKDS
jgi:hypothetical protein